MADTSSETIARIDTGDYTKQPYEAQYYADMRGVVDFGNLLQFAPYEKGYCFLAVISAPYMATYMKNKGKDYFGKLQDAFVKILEQEFKGLSGIDNITSETMEITDNISTLALISKVSQATNSQITMSFTEKSGSLITKYISTFLRSVKDSKTEAKTYGGTITGSDAMTAPGFHKEVFNMLYIVTDATCLNVEKAFLILNAQPTEAAYGDLYNNTKGEIGQVDIDVTFNAFVVDGSLPNKIAHVYLRNMIKTLNNKNGKININSYDFNWSISGINGGVLKADDAENGGIADLNINVEGDTNGRNITPETEGSIKIKEVASAPGEEWITYDPNAGK